MTTRVVVVGEHEVRFYDADNASDPLQLATRFEDAAAHLHDRDLESDRPGRSFDRGGRGRHAMDGERSARRHRHVRFARQVATVVELGRRNGQFDRLVLIAGPRMLGLIRPRLSEGCRAILAAEVVKDLRRGNAAQVRRHVPRSALAQPPRVVVSPH